MDRPAGVMRCAAFWSRPGLPADLADASTGLALAWGVGLVGRVWASGEPAFVPSVARDASLIRAPAAVASGAESAYVSPLLDGPEVLGVVEFFLPRTAVPDEEAERRVAAVAHELAGRIGDDLTLPPERGTAAERMLEIRAAHQAAVAELGRRALTSPSPDGLLDEAVRLVSASLDVDHCTLLTVDPQRRALVLDAQTGWPAEALGTELPALRGSPAGYALMRGEAIVSDDLAAEARFEIPPLLAEAGVTSCAVVIIRGPGEALGALAAHSPARGRFDADDVHFMRTAANVLAGALIRARVEEELRRANAILDAIVTGTPDAIYVKDADGNLVYVNEAAAAVAGRPAHEVIGRRSTDLFRTGSALEDQDREVMETGEWATFEQEVIRDGLRRYYSATKGPYRDPDGRVVGVIGLSRDMTAIKQAERRGRLLAEVGRVLAATTDLDATLQEVARVPLGELADACQITLRPGRGRAGRGRSASAGDLAEAASEAMRAAAAPVLEQGLPVLLAGDDAPEPVGSLIVLPLRARQEVFGTLSLATGSGRTQFDGRDLEHGVELAERIAASIDSALLFHDRAGILETLQRGLLPPELPPVPGLEVGTAFHAGRVGLDVGGDFYDVVPSGGGWLVVVGDVCGRGAEAATVTGVARHTLRGAALYDHDPGSLLRGLNAALLRDRLELRFCTLVCAHLMPTTGGFEVRLANAGHPGPVVCRAGGDAEVIEASGTLLGVFGDARFGETRFELGAGDVMVLYTDGLLDAHRATGSLQPEDLVAPVRAAAPEGAPAVAASLADQALSAAGEGALADDVAVLALRVLEHAGGG